MEITIGTFNCRSLLKNDRIENLVEGISKLKETPTIIGVAETKLTSEEQFSNESYEAILGARPGKLKQGGVGFIHQTLLTSTIIDIRNHRIASLTCSLENEKKMTVFQIYAPTAVWSTAQRQKEKKTTSEKFSELFNFYFDLTDLVSKDESAYKVVMGDFNARLDCGSYDNENFIGPHSMYEEKGRTIPGSIVVCFCEVNQLFHVNSKDDTGKTKQERFTYKDPRGGIHEYDFILSNIFNDEFKLWVHNDYSLFGFESDHRMVLCKMMLKCNKENIDTPRSNSKQKFLTQPLLESEKQCEVSSICKKFPQLEVNDAKYTSKTDYLLGHLFSIQKLLEAAKYSHVSENFTLVLVFVAFKNYHKKLYKRMMKRISWNTFEGIEDILSKRKKLNHLVFAENLILVAKNDEDASLLLSTIVNECVELSVDFEKTRLMRSGVSMDNKNQTNAEGGRENSANENEGVLQEEVKKECFESYNGIMEVHAITHLGRVFEVDLGLQGEIFLRIREAWKAFIEFSKKPNQTAELFEDLVLSELIYGCEIWALFRNDLEECLEAFYSLLKDKTKDEIKTKLNEKNWTIMNYVQARLLQWAKKSKDTKNRVLKDLMKWEVKGRGSKRIEWIRKLKDDIELSAKTNSVTLQKPFCPWSLMTTNPELFQ